MRSFIGTASILLVLTAAAPCPAGWCDEAGESIFCDDFDRYCVNPPDPPLTCTTNDTRNDAALRQVWRYSSWDYKLNGFCGAGMKGEDLDTVLTSLPYGGRLPNGGNSGGTLGQSTVDLTPYIQETLNGSTAVNGTDENPLVLRFAISAVSNALTMSNGYLELALGDPNGEVDDIAQAPTDFVMVGADNGAGCLSCKPTCSYPYASVDVAWPTVCQQDDPHALCPPKQTIVRKTLAIGALAMLDTDPCECRTDYEHHKVPRNPYVSYFDGIEWHALPHPENHGVGDFVWGWRQDTIVFTIKTNTVDISHTRYNGGTWFENRVFGLPRRYTGGFNRLRSGTGVSCQLENDVYACSSAYNDGKKKCKLMGEYTCTGNVYTSNTSRYASFDDVRLYGGVGQTVPGACCRNDATCVETDLTTCEQVLGGRYQGDNTTCDTTSCCPYPFADIDTDGDVDQDDFGLFQICLTGFVPSVPTGCECLNHNGDAGIDAADFEAFSACATGPNVPAVPVPAGCDP